MRAFSAFALLWMLTAGPSAAQALRQGQLLINAGKLEHKLPIAVLSIEGGGPPRVIGTQTGIQTDPSWTPEGRVIFVSVDPLAQTSAIATMKADGTDRQTVLALPQDQLALGPTVSPDGSRVLFYATVPGGTSQIYLVNPDGTQLKQLGPANSAFPRWSPDGKRIVFVTGDQANKSAALNRMEADGSQVLPLLSSKSWMLGPAWSPDGKLVAFSQRGTDEKVHLCTVPSEGGQPTQLTQGTASDLSPEFSADGQLIFFNRVGEHNAQVWVMGRDGSQPRALTSDPGTIHMIGGGAAILWMSGRETTSSGPTPRPAPSEKH